MHVRAHKHTADRTHTQVAIEAADFLQNFVTELVKCKPVSKIALLNIYCNHIQRMVYLGRVADAKRDDRPAVGVGLEVRVAALGDAREQVAGLWCQGRRRGGASSIMTPTAAAANAKVARMHEKSCTPACEKQMGWAVVCTSI